MERLTKRDEYGFAYIRGTDIIDMQEQNDEAIEKLADYEDAEEEGRLIKFPLSIGARIYEPFGYGFINEGVVCELSKFYEEIEIGVAFDGSPTAINTFIADHVGKTIFLTRAEAEAKLKEMEIDNE